MPKPETCPMDWPGLPHGTCVGCWLLQYLGKVTPIQVWAPDGATSMTHLIQNVPWSTIPTYTDYDNADGHTIFSRYSAGFGSLMFIHGHTHPNIEVRYRFVFPGSPPEAWSTSVHPLLSRGGPSELILVAGTACTVQWRIRMVYESWKYDASAWINIHILIETFDCGPSKRKHISPKDWNRFCLSLGFNLIAQRVLQTHTNSMRSSCANSLETGEQIAEI